MQNKALEIQGNDFLLAYLFLSKLQVRLAKICYEANLRQIVPLHTASQPLITHFYLNDIF